MTAPGVVANLGLLSNLGLRADRGLLPNLGVLWTPAQLFGPSDVGLWYDFSDTQAMRQDSAGTTAVTTLGQPVGFVADKSGRGNHAIQSTPTSRPAWDARKNTVTGSELLSTFTFLSSPVVSANSATAPDGTMTADRFEVSSGNTGFTIRNVGQAASPGTTPCAFSFYFRPDTGANGTISMGQGSRRTCLVNLATLAVTNTTIGGATSLFGTIVNVGGGWYRYEAAATADGAAGTEVQIVLASATAGSAVWLWGAQNERPASAPTSYQRVTTATDYADVGVPRGALFDGSDDWLVTAANLVMSSTDEVTVIVGVDKRSDAAAGIVAELSATIGSNNGVFAVLAPASAAANVQYASKGTTASAATVSTGVAAPLTAVLTGVSKISAPSVAARLNGAVAASNTFSQGTGNYGSHLLYLGRRGGTASPFNGRITQLIIIGRLLTADELALVERYVAKRSGVTL